MKEVLVREYTISKSKIIVIPHGVEKTDPSNDIVAKKMLNLPEIKVILFFGYLVRRKGLEILINAFQKLQKDRKDTVLLIGAGKNPRLKRNREYQIYYNNIRTNAEQIPNVSFIGFIPENELKTYVSAADIIVFPYSVPLAASGALAYVLGFGKIVLCSDILPFRELVKSDALLFKTNNSEDLCQKLTGLLNMNGKDYESLRNLIKNMRNDYSWIKVSRMTLDAYETIINN